MHTNETVCLVVGVALVLVLVVLIAWFTSSTGPNKCGSSKKDASGAFVKPFIPSSPKTVPPLLRPNEKVGYPDPSREDIYPMAEPPYLKLETPRDTNQDLSHFYGKEDRETMVMNVPTDCAHFPCSMPVQEWYPSLGTFLAPGTLSTLGQIVP